MLQMTEKQFQLFSKLIYDALGIYLSSGKREMLEAKINKLLRTYGLSSYEEYYRLLVENKHEEFWNSFVDEITIHKTDFFRENNHFEFICENHALILEKNKRIVRNGEIRAWSAGCSTGEEAYTLAMILKECLPSQIQIKILATDVSGASLLTASHGHYDLQIKEMIRPYFLQKYFKESTQGYAANADIKRLITFRLFNLMHRFPFQNTFDIIFCRNVMIYFDHGTQQQLLEKFYQFMQEGGMFFIGHSESLLNKRHQFQYMQPTVYLK